MLRQLARLTRPLAAAGPRALAIAVYADVRDDIQPAAEAGFEGVACVDDAARGCELLCDLFAATGDLRLRAWAEGLLEFLLWMHDGSGHWVNFVYDWTGCRNVGGRTSEAGVNFWQGRALNAMVKAWLVLGDQRARDALNLGMQAAGQPGIPSNVRALQMTALLHLLVAEPSVALLSQLGAWSDEILESRSGDLLMNSPDERGAPHLWGHIQEAVLADAGALLDREDLVAVAERSADQIFVQLIESGFRAGRVWLPSRDEPNMDGLGGRPGCGSTAGTPRAALSTIAFSAGSQTASTICESTRTQARSRISWPVWHSPMTPCCSSGNSREPDPSSARPDRRAGPGCSMEIRGSGARLRARPAAIRRLHRREAGARSIAACCCLNFDESRKGG